MAQTIITRDSLRQMLETADVAMQKKIVGRALVRLLQRQTADERASHATHNDNGVGFASCDAELGTKVAERYIQYGTLLEWQLQAWIRPTGKGGYPRICKYHRQLNEVAIEQAEKRKLM